MAVQYAPLFALETQFQAKNGRNLTGGFLRVFYAATDDPADTYSDYNLTRNPDRIVLDDNGRALVICDKSKAYRLEVYDAEGMLLWTEEPVYCSGTGGGGVSITKVISTDGSIAIDESVVGSTTTYDIGLAPRDNDEFLEWIKCSEEDCGSTWYPVYQEGTMETEAGQGIKVHKGQLYHFTNTFYVDPDGTGINYDTFNVLMYCGDNIVDSRDFDIDSSLNDAVQCEFSTDVVPAEDGHVYFKLTIPSTCEVTGEVQAHRIYSGINAVPDGVAEKEWVEENYQEKLTPGTGIEIDSNNVISTTAQPQVQADWAQSDSTAVDYIKNKPTVDQAYDASSTNAQSGTAVAEAIAGADNLFIAVYGVTTIGEVDTAYAQGKDILCRYNDGHGHVYSSQLSSLVSGIYTFTTTDGFTDYEFKLSPDGGTGAWSIGSRAIPSGTQLVPEATQSDAGEVLTVDQNGVPEWAPAQAPISAGNGIDITNNVISVDTSVVATQNDLAGKQDVISDLSSIRAGAALGATAVQDPNYVHTDENFTSTEKTKLSGIEAGAEANVQSDWAESDSSSDSFIRNKPGQTSLVAGTNITIVDDAQNNTVTISATGSAQVQADWTETDSTDPSYIQNKPSIPAAQVNADWNSSAGVSEILNKPSIPVVGTITL